MARYTYDLCCRVHPRIFRRRHTCFIDMQSTAMLLATVVAMACLVASGAFAVPGAHQDPRDDRYQSPLDHSELAAPRSEVINPPAPCV